MYVKGILVTLYDIFDEIRWGSGSSLAFKGGLVIHSSIFSAEKSDISYLVGNAGVEPAASSM